MDEEAKASRRPIRSYEDIEAFQRAMSMLKDVHQVAHGLPDHEKFDLASQMRRASKSIPATIAEGYGKRSSAKNFKLYLGSALGSANEMIVHLQVAESLGYLGIDRAQSSIAAYRVIGKQLTRLIEKWR